jgi:hypothetical protein
VAISGKAAPLFATALLISSALACSGTSGSRQEETATAPIGTPPPTVDLTAPNPSVRTLVAWEAEEAARREDDLFCTIELPESWRDALERGRVSIPDAARFFPFAVAPDGKRVFGSYYSQAWSGVVSLDGQGNVGRIRQSSDRSLYQHQGGSFDGRWLVWSVVRSGSETNDWIIYAWDSESGNLFEVAASQKVDGTPAPGPFVIPTVAEAKAAWVQANAEGEGEVHLYDLAVREDRVLSTGKVTPPVTFWGSRLIWVEKPDGTITGGVRFAMADIQTRAAIPVPDPLTYVILIGPVDASGDLLVWSEGYDDVQVWREGDPKMTQIFEDRDGQVDWVEIAGEHILEWRGLHAPMVADLRSRSVAPLTEENGWAYTNGTALALSRPLGPIVHYDDPLEAPPSETSVIDVRGLPPLPECPA